MIVKVICDNYVKFSQINVLSSTNNVELITVNKNLTQENSRSNAVHVVENNAKSQL